MLSARQVTTTKPKDKPYKLADSQGLYLYVAPTGSRAWRFNYRQAGKQLTKTYGTYPELSLAEAREAHNAFKASLRSPNTPQAKAAAMPTFGEVMADWLKVKLPSLSNPKHQIQVQNTLERFVLPALGNRPIDQIKRTELVLVVQGAQGSGRVETAHRVAGRIGMVFNYAMDIGLIESHPAGGLVRVLLPRKTKKHMASIPVAEVPTLMRAIEGYDEPVTRLGLKLLALTFTRTGELRGMRWSEIDEQGQVWVVPAERMKLRLPHVVPLASQTKIILARLKDMAQSDLVLESALKPGHPLSENTFLFALYRLGYRGRMTGHGFRALASTVLNSQSSFKKDVIERQLAHKEKDDVRAAYNRAEYLDERCQLMQWWADWLDSQSRNSSLNTNDKL